jgi:hypothetical protein
MSVELFTFDALAQHLKCSPDTARSLADRLCLPRSSSSDGQTLVNIGMLIDAVEIAVYADNIVNAHSSGSVMADDRVDGLFGRADGFAEYPGHLCSNPLGAAPRARNAALRRTPRQAA